MHERGEEVSAGNDCWGDLWRKDNSKSEREGLQDGSETCYDVRFEDCGGDKRQEAELEVVEILFCWD